MPRTNELVKYTNVRLTDEQRRIIAEKARELGTDSISVALRAILTEWAREHPRNGQQAECPQDQAA